jgi:transaldolase
MAAGKSLKIKLFADGANVEAMLQQYRAGVVRGFTTNPTLMRKDGVADYAAFAHQVLAEIKDLPISFEVFSGEFAGMESEAREIASWGKNVNVKIPITNTRGEFSGELIKALSQEGIVLNVTALLTLDQVRRVAKVLSPKTPAIVSVFAGRIADTGRDPMPIMSAAAKVLKALRPKAQLLWASSREVINIYQAQACGCRIITLTPDILKKLYLRGKDLQELSLETVKMFYNDARAAGYKIVGAA